MFSAVSFASTIEKKELSPSIEVEELVRCDYSSTMIFYRTYTRQVFTMFTNEVAYETVVVIDSICTSCYTITAGGVTSSTNCVNY